LPVSRAASVRSPTTAAAAPPGLTAKALVPGYAAPVIDAHRGAGVVPRLGRVLALACGLLAGTTAGCLNDLPRGRSCGDGWWDPEHEECDPSSLDDSYIDACRERGLGVVDAKCDPNSCEILATEQDCTRCGDGVATGDEPCDGNDLRGATCPGGSGVLQCDQCKLVYDNCPSICGDGIVSGTEECEHALSCGDDSDCGANRQCYSLFGECVPSQGFGPNLSCSYYNTKAIGKNKPYVSGTISRCTDSCFFGRNNCGFCGDGELDAAYPDFVYPNGDQTEIPAEVCDGDKADQGLLAAHCEPLCINDPINADVVVLCDFECNAGCTGFAQPEGVIDPGQHADALGCCLAKGSPCPNFGATGVPEFPCCSWLRNPEWLAEKKCVAKQTEVIPVTMVCP